jgi:hypothetical protein
MLTNLYYTIKFYTTVAIMVVLFLFLAAVSRQANIAWQIHSVKNPTMQQVVKWHDQLASSKFQICD